MSTGITIHHVAKVEVTASRTLGQGTSTEFVTRDITITTEAGERITIELFSHELETIALEMK